MVKKKVTVIVTSKILKLKICPQIKLALIVAKIPKVNKIFHM